MPETPPVPPALSAQEWAHWNSHAGLPNAEKPGETVYIVHADGIVSRVDHLEVLHNERVSVGTRHTHAAMALVNAALPDGDPAKITREDVLACLAVCEILGPNRRGWMESLAAKLAALLPPTEAR